MAAVRFPKPEVVITQAWIEVSLLNLVHLRDPDLLRTCAQINRNQKLIRDVNGRHLENFNDVITVLLMVQFT